MTIETIKSSLRWCTVQQQQRFGRQTWVNLLRPRVGLLFYTDTTATSGRSRLSSLSDAAATDRRRQSGPFALTMAGRISVKLGASNIKFPCMDKFKLSAGVLDDVRQECLVIPRSGTKAMGKTFQRNPFSRRKKSLILSPTKLTKRPKINPEKS